MLLFGVYILELNKWGIYLCCFIWCCRNGVMAEGSPRLGGGQVLTKIKARNRLLVSCTISPLFTVLKLKNKSYFLSKIFFLSTWWRPSSPGSLLQSNYSNTNFNLLTLLCKYTIKLTDFIHFN